MCARNIFESRKKISKGCDLAEPVSDHDVTYMPTHQPRSPSDTDRLLPRFSMQSATGFAAHKTGSWCWQIALPFAECTQLCSMEGGIDLGRVGDNSP